MSKELSNRRFATGTVTPQPGVPYRKLPNSSSSSSGQGHAAAAAAASSSAAAVPSSSSALVAGARESGGRQGPPRLTINNFSMFGPRIKKLPPDANTKAAVNTRLWQFPEQVLFACAKCRRDRIQSDSVAIDPKNKIILCTSCFTRIVRPRTYKPSRIVPFPSLLSWLNYKPSKVMDVSEDVMARPAEAVAPSGNRMALPSLANGDRPTSVEKLPAIGMNMVPAPTKGSGKRAGGSAAGGADLYAMGAAGKGTPDGKHPCLRVWGVCQHGETCLFRNAPADLCLAYLMGLCKGTGGSGRPEEDRRAGRRGPHGCSLLHQKIYDLPQTADPCPEVRYIGEIEGEEEDADEVESPWYRWIARRRRSPNSAEWQLWNNGALKTIFDAFVPAVPRPAKEKPSQPEVAAASQVDTTQVKLENTEDEEAPAEAPSAPAPVKLNLSDILSGLKSIKKEE